MTMMIVDLFLMLRCYAYICVLAVLLFVTAANSNSNYKQIVYFVYKHNGMSSIKEMLNIHSLFKSTIFFDDKIQVT